MSTEREEWFRRGRTLAAQGNLVIVCADGQCVTLPTLAKASVKPEMVAAIEKMIPSTIKRNVAVIANVSWATNTVPTLQAASHAIPFFGLLMGIACIGNSVWIFNGTASLLIQGCCDADVLIVDSSSLRTLPTNWKVEAENVMRNHQILIHDRSTYQLRSYLP